MKNVTVVTGAGSGIGLAVAKVFKNDAVLICGRTVSKVNKAVLQLKDEGIDVCGIPCDVADCDDVKALVKTSMELGQVRNVINSAAVRRLERSTIVELLGRQT